MMLMQQWQYLNLVRNTFYILFLAKCIVSNMQIISSRLYVLFGETCLLAVENLIPVNKINNLNLA